MKKIKSINIRDSIFFEDLTISFNEKMNCIMGGRGTGKSTILYFLKSALKLDAQKGKVNDILRNNLGLGTITVEMESTDGTMYQFVKTYNEDPQSFKHPNNEFVALHRIIDEIDCDFYETNSIEEIGRSPIDRLELIDKMIKNELADQKESIRHLQIELDANAQDVKTHNSKIDYLIQSLSQYENVESELEAFKANEPFDIKPDEKQAFENADANEKIRADEKRFFYKTATLYNDLKNQIKLNINNLEDVYQSAILDKDTFINKELLEKVLSHTNECNKVIKDKLNEIEAILSTTSEFLNSNYKDLLSIHDVQQSKFVQLKQKFDTNRDYYNKYNLLTNRIKEKQILERDIKEVKLKKQHLIEQRTLLLAKFQDVKNTIFNIRLAAISDINIVLEGDVMITLEFSGITYDYENKLREALKGSGLRYNELIYKIVETLKPDQFAKIIQDKNISQLCNITGIDNSRCEVLVKALADTEWIYEIESTYCEDLPDFKLKIDEGNLSFENYRNSDELSMGQRCTTVLPIIFAVSDNPLIIDQPEDNLDNKYISEKIHEIIRTQKSKRQLIFITHNPNIPVLSDSEFNLFLNYQNKKSTKEIEGNIDEVKDQIIKILEGGENAFRIRKDKYNIV